PVHVHARVASLQAAIGALRQPQLKRHGSLAHSPIYAELLNSGVQHDEDPCPKICKHCMAACKKRVGMFRPDTSLYSRILAMKHHPKPFSTMELFQPPSMHPLNNVNVQIPSARHGRPRLLCFLSAVALACCA